MGTTARLAAAVLVLILLSRLALAEEDPDFRRGCILTKAGKYADAAAAFRAALARNPNDPDALLWLGKSYARMDDFEKAIEHLEKAKALRPDDEETLRELGGARLELVDRARRKEKREEAQTQLHWADGVGQALLKLPPKEKESYQFLIDLCLHQTAALHDANEGGKVQDFYPEALGYCEKVLAIDPNCIAIHLQRIRILMDQTRLKEAERRCGEVLKINPKLNSPRITLAKIHRVSNDPDGAIAILTGLLAEKKTQIEARLFRAEIYLDKEMYEEALADANEVIRLTNRNAQANFLRGCIYMHMKKLDAAIVEFQQAAAQMPKHVPTHFWLARCYLMKDHLREAIEELDIAVKLDPRLAPEPVRSLQVQAAIALSKGEIDQGIAHCLKAIEVDPTNVDVRFLLGRAYQSKGRLDEAQAQFEKILELRGRHQGARMALVKIHEQRGQFDLAEKQLLSCIEQDPALREPRYELARLYGLQRQFDKAQAALEELRKLEPDKAKLQKAIDELQRQRAEPPKAAPK